MIKKFVPIAVEPKTRTLLRELAAIKRTNLYQLVLTLAEESKKKLDKNTNIGNKAATAK